MSDVLDVRGLTVQYGEKVVVRSASFSANRGEVLAISGRSGAGKSTLLYSIAGLVPSLSGTIVLNDLNITSIDEPEITLTRRHIGFVFQDAALFHELNVLDNVVWVGRLRGLALRASRAEANDVLKSLGIAHLTERMPGEISGGEAQRVSIARALMGGTSLLLVDEPTAALDSETSVDVCRTLERVTRESNVATVVVSHDPIVLDFADRHLSMMDGTLN